MSFANGDGNPIAISEVGDDAPVRSPRGRGIWPAPLSGPFLRLWSRASQH